MQEHISHTLYLGNVQASIFSISQNKSNICWNYDRNSKETDDKAGQLNE